MIRCVALIAWALVALGAHAGDGAVTPERALGAERDPANWLLHGRTYSEQRYSPLTEINIDTVARLGLAWSADVASIDGLVATPIVVDGVVYISSTFGNVYALDAATGAQIWHFDPQVKLDASSASSWSARVNRGVAVWNGTVYIGTGDCRLIAIDAARGGKIWDTLTCDPKQMYGITGAPRVANGKVYIGNLGADFGARGYVTAYDAATGAQIWRFYTVPGDPAKGFENDTMAMAAKTWSGGEWWKSGGGNAWDAIVYDPEFNQIYIGTDSALPWNTQVRSPGGGDNLFLNSIIAVDADTGAYKWHYQQVPADAWDYNATMPIILAELRIDGKPRKVLMQAPKNGFFYVLDRATGALISAEDFVNVTWAERIDLKTGRPVERPQARYYAQPGRRATVSPGPLGAHSWHPMSFSPRTGLVYIPAQDLPSDYEANDTMMLGGARVIFDTVRGKAALNRGRLIAWDPAAQRSRWEVLHPVPMNGGTLATAGDLVFQGTATGEFHAYDARDGRKLWARTLNSSVQAAPVSYAVDATQYVLLPVGWGGIVRFIVPEYGASAAAALGPSRLLAFKLGGAAPLPEPVMPEPIPEPPLARPDPALVARGGLLYEGVGCLLCHGVRATKPGGGSVPDLRRASAATHAEWFDIVLGGKRRVLGMPAFNDAMSAADAEAIRAYVLEQAWTAHGAPSQPH